MRDQDVGVRIVIEIVFQPIAGLQIEVVGGLVEQQHVGLFQQQFGQGDAHLPAAAELLGLPQPIFLGKTQAGQHGAYLRLQGVTVAVQKLALDAVKAFAHLFVLGACRISLAHAPGQLFQLTLHGVHVVKDREAFGKDRAAAQIQPVLREIAGSYAFAAGDVAVISDSISASTLSRVDFPVPLAPTRPTRSCGVINQFRFSKSNLWP